MARPSASSHAVDSTGLSTDVEKGVWGVGKERIRVEKRQRGDRDRRLRSSSSSLAIPHILRFPHVASLWRLPFPYVLLHIFPSFSLSLSSLWSLPSAVRSSNHALHPLLSIHADLHKHVDGAVVGDMCARRHKDSIEQAGQLICVNCSTCRQPHSERRTANNSRSLRTTALHSIET